jgi:ribokinase
MDLVFPVRELPSWKQAVQAKSFKMYPGGKGLNQAVALARLGSEVSLISAVGFDDFGEQISDFLQLERVNHNHVQVVKEGYTDVTSVFVNEVGDVAYVGWKGISDTEISKEQIKNAEETIRQADALLITFEVPIRIIKQAMEIAKVNNTLIILNPSPPLDQLDAPPYELLNYVYALIPNEWEANQFLRTNSESDQLAYNLHEMGATISCVTNGKYGCSVAIKGKVKNYPSFSVGQPVDTTGGTDAFCATFTVCTLAGFEIDDAFTIANAAAAFAVTKRGGSPSMPTIDELNRFLEQHKVALRL